MKDLTRIFSRLSDVEKRDFKSYLNRYQKRSFNKKELLMDLLLRNGGGNIEEIRLSMRPPISKQALYQLKKRLKSDLINFMLANRHVSQVNHVSDSHWNCYKMLYYFHVLIERELWQDARKLLNELEDQAQAYHMPEIVLTVQALRNHYFPLTPTSQQTLQTSNLINDTLEGIRMSQCQNEYLQTQFGFCEKSMGNTSGIPGDTAQLYFNNRSATCFTSLESLYIRQNYIKAYRLAYRMLLRQPFFLNQSDKISRGMLYLYLSKAAIGKKNLPKADTWLREARSDFCGLECWELHTMELRFYIELRRNRLHTLPSLCRKARAVMESARLQTLTYRWQLFEAFLAFEQQNFRRVIQLANQCSDYSPPLEWSFAMGLLELLSIRNMNDPDWMLYKLESLRKKVSGQFPKGHRFISVLKKINHQQRSGDLVLKKGDDDVTKTYLNRFDPIGPEVINFFTLINTSHSAKKKVSSV